MIGHTTDYIKILEFAKNNYEQYNMIISVTYNSLNKISKFINSYDKKIDNIFYDEAHHVINRRRITVFNKDFTDKINV